MERKPRRRRRGWKRRLIIIGVALLVIALGIGFGVFYYPKLNQERLLSRGKEASKAKDYQAAVISFRRVLQINDRNVDATRAMAELAETVGAGEALYWRRRLVELEPQVEAHHVALVERAVQSRNAPAMREAIGKLLEISPKSAKSQFLAGRVAAATNDPVKARDYFAAAVSLDPQNAEYKYELAEAQLIAGQGAEADEARKSLEAALGDKERFARASRTLIADAMRRREFARAIELSDRLQKSEGAKFEERLGHLAVLKQTGSPEYPAFLEELQSAAVKRPEDVYALISWLNSTGSAMVAVEWSKRVPGELVAAYPVPIALAQAYATLGDWQSLKPMVEVKTEPPVDGAETKVPTPEEAGKDWKTYEFLRVALHAWTLRRNGDEKESKVQWNEAVRLAGRNSEALTVLVQAADNWGWINEATDVLWLIAEQPTMAEEALTALNQRYFNAGNTRGLLRVATKQVQLNPGDLPTRNNLAAFLLLLGDPKQGLAVAEELHKAKPEDPAYTSTYAFALHLHGRTDEAVKLMRSLGEERLKDPSYAAYLGVMLTATPQKEEARKWLELGRTAPLLPEERQLLEEASAKLVGAQ